jgi:simple sugar transport system substrate-binding protein
MGVLGIALTTICLALAACGDDDDDSRSAAAGSADTDFKIAFAMIGVPGEKFYNVIRNGAEQAGEDLGVEVDYKETKETDFQEQARLIEAVAATKPDAMIVSDHEAETLNPPIKAAVDSGIPVVIIDAGGEEAVAATGALGFVSSGSQFDAGVLVGQRMKEIGATRLICFNQDVGTEVLDQRCEGLNKGFGGPVQVVGGFQGEDRTATRNALKAALQRSSDVDGVVALGGDTGEEAAAAVRELNKVGEVKVGTFDLTPQILQSIQDGVLDFAIDQQQWLWGYLAVQQQAHLLRYQFRPPRLTSTDFGLVTKENAAEVVELSKQDIR